MEQLLQGVKYTVCCLDDILISGGSSEQHLAILEEVFRQLQEHGSRLNPAKCIFVQLGFKSFSDTGLTKTAFIPSLRRWMQHKSQESYQCHGVKVVSGTSQLSW